MRKLFLLLCATLLFFGCTKEPDMVDIEELVESILAEMDYWGDDGDALLTDEEAADDDTLTGDADDLLSDD